MVRPRTFLRVSMRNPLRHLFWPDACYYRVRVRVGREPFPNAARESHRGRVNAPGIRGDACARTAYRRARCDVRSVFCQQVVRRRVSGGVTLAAM